jgi:hypothetical protein
MFDVAEGKTGLLKSKIQRIGHVLYRHAGALPGLASCFCLIFASP